MKKQLIHLTLSLVLAVGVILAGSAAPAQAAATFTVNNTTDKIDTSPGDGVCMAIVNGLIKCTLRAAIMESNALAGADTINLPAGTYLLTRLGTQEDNAGTGDLDITGTLTINGAGAGTTFVDGTGNGSQNPAIDRVFEILASSNATIYGVTVRNGVGKDGGGGINVRTSGTLTLNSSTITNNRGFFDSDPGGGILNSGTLTINDSIITNNFVGNTVGGGIDSVGTLTITNSTITLNTAFSGTGGGVAVGGAATITNSTISNNSALFGGGLAVAGGTATITNSSITNNTVNSSGGGISNSGTLNLLSSTVSGNTTTVDSSDNRGGGLINLGTANITNSTVSGNSAKRDGGGLFNQSGTLNLASTTIANNKADSDTNNTGNGGGLAILGGTVNAQNTLFADNVDASLKIGGIKHPDCSGTLTSQGFNLIESTAGCTITGNLTGNVLGQDPGLFPLQNNGGPTATQLISFGPALDAGNPTGCTDFAGALLAIDQRGLNRHQGAAGGSGRCDIGAVELVQNA